MPRPLLSLAPAHALEDAGRIAHAFHHAFLEPVAPAVARAGAGEDVLRLLLVARGEERHAEVGERVRGGAELARAGEEVDRLVELLALVVDPAERRERELLELVGRVLERAARVVERLVEVLFHL